MVPVLIAGLVAVVLNLIIPEEDEDEEVHATEVIDVEAQADTKPKEAL